MTVDDLLRRLMWEIDELRSALIFGRPCGGQSKSTRRVLMWEIGELRSALIFGKPTAGIILIPKISYPAMMILNGGNKY